MLIELNSGNATNQVKLQGLESLIQFGAAVLETRDLSIDINSKLSIWPDFDAVAAGSKYAIPGGVDPDKIRDPKIREAYKDALAKHRVRLAQVVPEKRKIETANESLGVAKDLLNQLNSDEAVAYAKQAIAKLPSQP